MLELAGRGHQVTEVTPFLESQIVPNYTQIEVKANFATATGGRGKRTREGNFKLVCKEIYFFKFLMMIFLMFFTVHQSIELFHLPTLMHNSLLINNMYVTPLPSTCFEDCNITYILLMNKELCIKVGK